MKSATQIYFIVIDLFSSLFLFLFYYLYFVKQKSVKVKYHTLLEFTPRVKLLNLTPRKTVEDVTSEGDVAFSNEQT